MTSNAATGSGGAPEMVVGVDTGGTFTDFVCLRDGRLDVLKLASTPAAPEQAVLDGVAQLQAGADASRLVHGSTVATNALLEGRLARTAYVTNTGLADVLTLGRQARRELYNLQPAPQPPPVPAECCLEINQRTAADGQILVEPQAAEIRQLIAQLRRLDVEAVAINLLFCFRAPATEQRLARAIRQALPALRVSCASDVLPEYGEYERGIATWINAGLAPRMARYLAPLADTVPDLSVMHGAAGTVDVDQASAQAANLLLSGPAGGLTGARHLAALAGCERVLTLDMGGTSTDVALIDADADTPLALTSEARIGGYPVAVPMVDMHTIGAGGGSIAAIDAGGLLSVGPASAGADPGPACYARGGEQPTVTDANVVLGRLPAASRLGGALTLDARAARRALTKLANSMGSTPEAAAQGVIDVADEAMARALRVISVQRGEDPRAFSLLSFGGAGGLHVCALAEALDMHAAMVPVHAGVLSALGMLVARRSRSLSRSLLKPVSQLGAEEFARTVRKLSAVGEAQLVAEGLRASQLEVRVSLDLRYLGQSFSLNLEVADISTATQAFHRAHEARYGHRLDLDVEVVNLRLDMQGPQPQVTLPQVTSGRGRPPVVERVAVHGQEHAVPVYRRAALGAGHELYGPAIICEPQATTWLRPDWQARVDAFGNLMLRRS